MTVTAGAKQKFTCITLDIATRSCEACEAGFRSSSLRCVECRGRGYRLLWVNSETREPVENEICRECRPGERSAFAEGWDLCPRCAPKRLRKFTEYGSFP